MKFKCQMLTFLTLFTSAFPILAIPTLGVATTNNQTILFWNHNVSGINGVLESATSLSSQNWNSATDAIPFNYNSQTAVLVSNTTPAKFFRVSFVPPTSDGMALIPPGSFTIGTKLDHITGVIVTNVYISGFYMDTNPISYSQWQIVYAYATNLGYSFVHVGAGKGANHPVQSVDWYDCVKWCNARSQLENLTPVYYTDAGFQRPYTNGETANVFANWMAVGYRLPTEAEWEKAARGGLNGKRFPWGTQFPGSMLIIMEIPLHLVIHTILPQELVWIHNSTPEIIHTRVQLQILHPMDTGYTIWLATCMSGAGIGIR